MSRLSIAAGVFALAVHCTASAGPSDSLGRVGVNVQHAAQLERVRELVPIDLYKDFSAFGGPRGEVGYVPILLWQERLDGVLRRWLLGGLFLAGEIAAPADVTLSDFMDFVSLERLGRRIGSAPDAYPPGTLFLLGIEPGYAPNGDPRTPDEIAADARALRGLLDAQGRGYRLGLGGISTPRNEHTHSAYGGRFGIDFFRLVAARSRDVAFDAYTVHPYPADPANPSAGDSIDQIREFRRLMAELGLRDRPLLVGEIGVPFPAAPDSAVLAYTEEIVPFLLDARDEATGCPGDDDRLVQHFTWFIGTPPDRPVRGFTDNPALDMERSALVSSDGRLTAVGKAFVAAVQNAASTSIEANNAAR